jgi:hypothetical protein
MLGIGGATAVAEDQQLVSSPQGIPDHLGGGRYRLDVSRFRGFRKHPADFFEPESNFLIRHVFSV